MSNVRNLAEARAARSNQEMPQDGGKGYALLHRKIMDLPFYKEPEAAHLWVHLILKAKYSPEHVQTELGEKLVRRGELLSGKNALAYETGLTPDRVEYLLRKFKKLGMINWVSTSKFRIFSITKYDDYQPNSVHADYPQITPANPCVPMSAGDVVHADYPQITTDNEVLNTNNSISNDIECASAIENEQVPQGENPTPQGQKKPALSCEAVLAVYHEVLPEAKGVRLLSDKRRNQIRTFWKKATKITRQLDGQPFTLESWRQYLEYIAGNCRWMLEDRQDTRSGRVWHRKGLEYFLNDETYLLVREGAKDDR